MRSVQWRLVDSGVRPITFPQKHTRQIFPLCEVHVLSEPPQRRTLRGPSEASRLSGRWQMLCSRIPWSKTCTEEEELSFKIFFPVADVFELRRILAGRSACVAAMVLLPAFHVAREEARGTTRRESIIFVLKEQQRPHRQHRWHTCRMR